MVNTFKIQLLAWATVKHADNLPVPIDDSDKLSFRVSIPQMKSKFVSQITVMLQNAGFYFAPDLWKWIIDYDNCKMWVVITFEDTNNDGKTKFLNEVANTGLLDYSYKILHSYGP